MERRRGAGSGPEGENELDISPNDARKLTVFWRSNQVIFRKPWPLHTPADGAGSFFCIPLKADCLWTSRYI